MFFLYNSTVYIFGSSDQDATRMFLIEPLHVLPFKCDETNIYLYKYTVREVLADFAVCD